jgi:hypothetical protein
MPVHPVVLPSGTAYGARSLQPPATSLFQSSHRLSIRNLRWAAFSLAVTAGFLVLTGVFCLVMIAAQGGSPAHVVAILPGSEWHDIWIHVLAILVSGGVCVLIGVAGAAVGRSLPFAMMVAIGFFPLDNLVAGSRDYNVYQLGPNLNVLAETLGHMRESLFVRPAQPVDTAHSLVVIGVFCATSCSLPTSRPGAGTSWSSTMPTSSVSCLVRAELRKVVLQRSNWALPVVAVAVGGLAGAAAGDQAHGLGPFQFAIDTYRAFAAGAAGVVVLAVSARLVAMEYHAGTIRVVLAQGVGPLPPAAGQGGGRQPAGGAGPRRSRPRGGGGGRDPARSASGGGRLARPVSSWSTTASATCSRSSRTRRKRGCGRTSPPTCWARL